MHKPTLLLGNGLNNVTNLYQWGDLIEDLLAHLRLRSINMAKEKPFPLLYEEIFLTSLRQGKYSEHELKSFIADKVKCIQPGSLHARITALSFSDIMTTNYDYAIENSLGYTDEDFDDQGIVKQSRLNLFRHSGTKRRKIWHIHGEINKPGTILLGYEHYSAQLQQMRNYVVLGTGKAYQKELPALVRSLKDHDVKNNSWIDLFFTKDIHIVGLTLDFVELELWWLLTYRARLILEKKLPIKNKIVYYYPGMLESQIQCKLEMLRANEVLTRAIGDQHDIAYYEEIFDCIQTAIKS